MVFKYQSGNQPPSIAEYVVFSIIIGLVVACLYSPLNLLLKRYGQQLNPVICNSVWSLKNENLQRLFYQMCIATKDNHLSKEEIYSLIDGIQNSFNHPGKEFFYQDERIREIRVHYATGYAIDSYINKLNVKPFVKFDKPKGYFEDVYQPNKYNEEQRVLLEQAQYIEFPNNQSKAQEILGPTRELKYVGLHFPYGISMEKDTDK